MGFCWLSCHHLLSVLHGPTRNTLDPSCRLVLRIRSIALVTLVGVKHPASLRDTTSGSGLNVELRGCNLWEV